jgi:hypothetical protein
LAGLPEFDPLQAGAAVVSADAVNALARHDDRGANEWLAYGTALPEYSAGVLRPETFRPQVARKHSICNGIIPPRKKRDGQPPNAFGAATMNLRCSLRNSSAHSVSNEYDQFQT